MVLHVWVILVHGRLHRSTHLGLQERFRLPGVFSIIVIDRVGKTLSKLERGYKEHYAFNKEKDRKQESTGHSICEKGELGG